MNMTPDSTSDDSPMNQDQDAPGAPVVWLITDNKPGHRNQLKGLGSRLRVLADARVHWIEAPAHPVPLWRVLLARPPELDASLPPPDLIVAAGTGTHRLLLSLRRHRKARTLVLMKPGFPLALVDGAIIPAHDEVAESAKVCVTEGAINAVSPMAKITGKNNALILVGGPSRHFEWQEDKLLDQIGNLIARYPGWHWTLADSRRTPDSMAHALARLESSALAVLPPRGHGNPAAGVRFVRHQDTYEGWLSHQFAASRAVWVTPDSMSMVCEAATSGVPTGLLELRECSGSRVARGVARLCQLGYVARWQDHETVMGEAPRPALRLWEADRAARWVLSRLIRAGQP